MHHFEIVTFCSLTISYFLEAPRTHNNSKYDTDSTPNAGLEGKQFPLITLIFYWKQYDKLETDCKQQTITDCRESWHSIGTLDPLRSHSKSARK